MASQRDRVSQETKILRLLQDRWPSWTSALDLSSISLQYNARIFSLRRQGHLITNKVTVNIDGVRRGFYRLGPPPTPRSAELRKQQGKEPLSAQQIELLNIGTTPERYPD